MGNSNWILNELNIQPNDKRWLEAIHLEFSTLLGHYSKFLKNIQRFYLEMVKNVSKISKRTHCIFLKSGQISHFLRHALEVIISASESLSNSKNQVD